MGDNIFLNVERDRVKVLLLLQQDGISIIHPEVFEVSFNFRFQLVRNVLAALVWLIPDVFYYFEPLVELDFDG